MKKLALTLILSFLSLSLFAQDEPDMGELKQYYFVMLTKGPNRSQDSATAAEIQAGHMSNMKRLADMNKLVVAGPFLDNGDWRGIFIFDVATKEEVEELLKSDPAISAGRLSYEIHPWMTQKGNTFK